MNTSQAKRLFQAIAKRVADPDLGLATGVQLAACIREELVRDPAFMRHAPSHGSDMLLSLLDGSALRWDTPDNFAAVRSVKSVFDRVVPRDVSSLYSILDAILRELFVYKSSVVCPSCGDDDLGCFYDATGDVVVFNCEICDWTEVESGRSRSASSSLIPAPANVLRLRGLLGE